MANIAINGLGRIGRAVLKGILDDPELELVAVNDLISADSLAYLLRYDTVYGHYGKAVEANGNSLIIDGRSYQVLGEKDPANLPWERLDIDIVLECTGVFTRKEDLQKHIEAGARHVILSAPAKSEGVPTIVYGVNRPEKGSTQIVSCASCTTNCITPVVEVMKRRIGIKKAIMTTIHAYTSTQSIVDGPHKKDPRRGRAGAANLVPTSTGAAKATIAVLPELENRFHGVAVRAPVPVGSVADITFVCKGNTSAEAINDVFRQEADTGRYRGILGISEDPLVSSDIIKDSRASVVDLGMTQVVDGDLAKIMSWYDNEWGYTCQMVRVTSHIASLEG